MNPDLHPRAARPNRPARTFALAAALCALLLRAPPARADAANDCRALLANPPCALSSPRAQGIARACPALERLRTMADQLERGGNADAAREMRARADQILQQLREVVSRECAAQRP